MISKNWTRENLAYLAGLLEGEGSFTLHDKRGHALQIKLKMTDKDAVEKAFYIAGCGTFCGPYKTPKKDGSGGYHKDSWVWHVQKASDSYALAVAILPWMCERRKTRILEIISNWIQWERNKPKPGLHGEKNHQAKLSFEDVKEIKNSTESANILSERFSVSPSAIYKIRNGRSWKCDDS